MTMKRFIWEIQVRPPLDFIHVSVLAKDVAEARDKAIARMRAEEADHASYWSAAFNQQIQKEPDMITDEIEVELIFISPP